jgi:hypothetical protein
MQFLLNKDLGSLAIRDSYGELVGLALMKKDHGYEPLILFAAAPELARALESLILFTKPTKLNAAALNNAYRILESIKNDSI